jgi:hypothetical protein
MSVGLAPKSEFGPRLLRYFRRNPEWWVFTLAVAAWSAVIPHAVAHQGHVSHVMPFEVELENWVLMSTAMMLPLMRDPLRWVASRGFYGRRHRSIAWSLAAFLGVWALAGVPAAWLRTFEWVHEPLLPVGAFCVAAVWNLAPSRDRALAYCHLTSPLAPAGIDADRDCAQFGARLGGACVVTCWPLMLACTLTGHSLPAMVGGALLGSLERRSFHPAREKMFVGTLLLALWFLLPISRTPFP